VAATAPLRYQWILVSAFGVVKRQARAVVVPLGFVGAATSPGFEWKKMFPELLESLAGDVLFSW
jgi:hypothetical protein